MCGLIVSSDPALVPRSRFQPALDELAPRGPDASGYAVVDGIAFGHQRLAIIGLGPQGAQPMVAADTGNALVYNGEIYNYAELARTLGISATSDTQVLFALLSARRWDLLGQLRGMYAFVFWDARRSQLLAARDRFGIKPLFVAASPSAVSLASSVAALAHLPHVGDVDAQSVTAFLAAGFFPAGRSVFAEVAKVVPGHLHSWTRTGATWHRDASRPIAGTWPERHPADAVRDSVAAHLVADVEVGVLMSGGVDSTLLAALAAAEHPGIRTFCLTNPQTPAIDEAGYARHNAALIGTRHLEVPVTASELVTHVEALVRFSGEPFGDDAYLALTALTERVSSEVKVALAGEGADELFGGYRRYDIEQVINLPGPRQVAAGAARWRGYPRRYDTEPPSVLGRVLASAGHRDDYLRHLSLLDNEWAVVSRAAPSQATAALATARAQWHGLPGSPLDLAHGRGRAFDTQQWLPNVFLEKSDRASMLWGLEVRVPYLDPVVARSVQGRRTWTSRKAVLRRTLSELVPGVTLPKRKLGLAVDVPGVLAAGLDPYAEFALWDAGSPLAFVDHAGRDALAQRSRLAPGLRFRLGVLGVWADQRRVR